MNYNCKTWPDSLITGVEVLQRPRGKRVGKNKRMYLNIVGAFDIETSTVRDKYARMWIWQLQIGLDSTIIGRSWKEFTYTIKRISGLLDPDIYLVLFVHNLSFEFQFLRSCYHFKRSEVFAVNSRKILRCDMYDHIELRCSYLHTNMRLETFLEKMGVEDQKLAMDYTKPRYPWTPVTTDELEYCIHDVRGLVQAIYTEMLHDGDNLYTIPATSTGYVRRDVKKALRPVRKSTRALIPSLEVYDLLREAFRGGNTHANRYYSGQVIDGVMSYDISSSYPASQMIDKYPISPLELYSRAPSIDRLEDMIYRRKKACLFRLKMWGVELRDRFQGAPYLPYNKCRAVSSDAVLDNGRILSASYLEITATDIDYDLIMRQYSTVDRQAADLHIARYGDLPQQLKECIMEYYRNKTELKGNAAMSLLYEKSKNRLNAIYGMSATDMIKALLLFCEGCEDLFAYEDKSREDLHAEAAKKAFFPYQWGIWCTARARQRLQTAIDLVQYENMDPDGDFIYCDTDSVKYTGSVDWEKINGPIRELAEAKGAFADRDGKRYYMGVFEPDYKEPVRFATRGAKKYVVEKDGRLYATIAGVSRREDGGRISGGMELMENGGFSAFLQDHFIFTKSAAYKLLYNDYDRFTTRIDGHRLNIGQCVAIVPGSYDLHDTPEYAGLLEALEAEEVYHFVSDVFGKSL